MHIAFKFAYDGMNYHGYARQPDVNTIEGTIINILKNEDYFDNPKDAVFRSASRTDKGASSLGNVISFHINKDKSISLKELNTNENIVFYGYKKVDADFYPRYARQRIYSYYLPRNNINLDQILNTLDLFTGTHDFSNFARIEHHKDPMRTIDNIMIEETDDFFVINFYAQTYLWHQIRRIISAILNVNKKKISENDILHALEHPEKNVDFGVAPAVPLILKEIIYSFSFIIDTEEEKKVKRLESFLVDKIKCLF